MSEEIKNIPQEENLSELLQVRRDKLKNLQEVSNFAEPEHSSSVVPAFVPMLQ